MIDNDFKEYVESLDSFDLKKMLRRLDKDKFPEKVAYINNYIELISEKEEIQKQKKKEQLEKRKKRLEEQKKEAQQRQIESLKKAQEKQLRERKEEESAILNDQDLYQQYFPEDSNDFVQEDNSEIDDDLASQLQHDIRESGGGEIPNIAEERREQPLEGDDAVNAYKKVVGKKIGNNEDFESGLYEVDNFDGHSIAKIQSIFVLMISGFFSIFQFLGSMKISILAALFSLLMLLFTLSLQTAFTYFSTRLGVWAYNLIAKKFIKLEIFIETLGFNISEGTMKIEIKKINPFKVSVIYTIFIGIFSLTFLPFMLLIMKFIPGNGSLGFVTGFTLFIMPVLYIIIGFVFTYLITLLYNYIAKKYVAFEMDINKTIED